MNSEPEGIRVPVIWIGADDVPIELANSFIAQFLQDEIILTVGQLVPPALLGSEEERIDQAKKVSFVPVRVVSRLALTRQRTVELVTALNDILAKYDAEHKRRG